jgi:arylsulfatase A-like enzyme
MCAQTPEKTKPNVILILLDQLQADRLHCYGNLRATSPNIDRLAGQGIRFSHYYSVASWTEPSDGSLMTSLFPSRHGATLFCTKHGEPKIDVKVPMLAQVFKAGGYHTAAFVNNSVGGKGLTDRGFDEYYQEAAEAIDIVRRVPVAHNAVLRAPATTRNVLAWLDQHHSEPFFLWLLYLEPHSPYDPLPEHDIFKSDAYPERYDTGYDIKRGPLRRLAMLGDQNAIERLYELYDGKIHFIDYYVGKILDHLQKLGLDQNTVIVLTSDHGELLFSHPRDWMTTDHISLYDADVHIPLILAGPGLPHGRVIDALGSNVDAAPTILDLARLPPLPDAQGRSLVPVIQGKAKSVHEYAYSEQDDVVPLRSIRNSRYKLIYNLWGGTKDPRGELFDLAHDPNEQQDIATHNPSVTTALFGQLQKWMTENEPPYAELARRWKGCAAHGAHVIDDQTVAGQLRLTGGGWHSDESPQSLNYSGGEMGLSEQMLDVSTPGGCFWTEGGDGSRTAVGTKYPTVTGR